MNDNLIETLSLAPLFARCEQSTLEELVGVAGPSLSRVLSELKTEGVIERTLDGIQLRKSR